MKRIIYAGLILAMLLLIVFPPAIHAEDDRDPFDYLNEAEQTYVTNMRSAIAEAKAKVDTARTDLQTFFLQDYPSWYNQFMSELNAINSVVNKIKQVNVPASFSVVGQQSQALVGVPADSSEMFLSPDIALFTLVEAAYALSVIDGNLKKVDQSLDSLSSSLETRVNEVAEAQKKGEEILDELLSCAARPARAY